MSSDISWLLPHCHSKEGLERDVSLSEAEELGIHPCGDRKEGRDVYKLLTREGIMITYYREGDSLAYGYSMKLHE